MSSIPMRRRIRLAITVTIVLMVILFIKRLSSDNKDTIEPNLQALERLHGLYKDDLHVAKKITGSPQILQNSPSRTKQISWLSRGKCPAYLEYSEHSHDPLSKGPLKLPYQRPETKCRTFTSPSVEKLIDELLKRIEDPDLARLTENALPNTLDTTILYHSAKSPNDLETFVVTGDIHAEWLRDSARQLSIYQSLTKYEPKLKNLIKGAINTQAKYITVDPYCNAFHPPLKSSVSRGDTAMDKVFPKPNWLIVFECKWEIDSLASFLTLTREYYEATKDASIFDERWLNAISNLLIVLKRESSPTFDSNGKVLPFYYTFQRDTNIGSETLPLAGLGNPVNFDIGLIRSAFRPSDDATIYQFFIPGNAYMQVELSKISDILLGVKDQITNKRYNHEKIAAMIDTSLKFAKDIKTAIYEHAVFDHPKWGKVFAYEIDGYGGTNFMDDANIPSLLSLPDLGFISKDDPIYQNTRKMILSKSGNPYYLQGPYFQGIGGPHIGIHNAWPMSLLLEIRTSDSDEEIRKLLEMIKTTTGRLGLIHESIHVNVPYGQAFTRPWFSWANSEFGKTILDLAKRKPHLIFKEGYKKNSFDITDILKI